MKEIISDFSESLNFEFYQQNTVDISKQLIGKVLVKNNPDGNVLAGMIVETEAYLAENDKASHSATGKSRRNSAMFEHGGILYVYKIYGIHHCINVVIEESGKGCAVFIRAIEPISGIDIMKKNRNIDNVNLLCKGPGNVSKAFDFTLNDNYSSLLTKELYIGKYKEISDEVIGNSKRIGITKSIDHEFRFFLKNNPFISGKMF